MLASPAAWANQPTPTFPNIRLAVRILCQRVWQLRDEELAAGTHLVEWDGRDDSGRALPSGVYFGRLETTGRETATQKMVLLR